MKHFREQCLSRLAVAALATVWTVTYAFAQEPYGAADFTPPMVLETEIEFSPNMLASRRLDVEGLRSIVAPEGVVDDGRALKLLLELGRIQTPKAYRLKWFEPDQIPTDSQVSWAFIRGLNPIDRHEIEPDTAEPIVREGLKSLDPTRKTEAIERLIRNAPRQRDCGDAVRELRAPQLDLNGGGSQDRLTNFQALCLAGGKPGNNLFDKASTKRCAAIYNDVAKYCFSTDALSQEQRVTVVGLAGIIVTSIRGGPRSIICSAFRVGDHHVLSARHCLSGMARDADALHSFLPLDPSSNNDGVELTALRVAPTFARSMLADVLRDSSGLSTSIDTDIVLFETKTPLAPLRNGLSLLPVKAGPFGQAVVLASFQRLASRAIQVETLLAKGVIPNDEALLLSGDWRKAYPLDATPTCRLLEFSPDEATRPNASFDRAKVAGHMCQSLGTGSGGAMIAYSETDPSELYIAAVHSGAAGALATIAGPVEAYQPRNLGIMSNPDLASAVEKAEAALKIAGK